MPTKSSPSSGFVNRAGSSSGTILLPVPSNPVVKKKRKETVATVIHCSWTNETEDIGVTEIQRWHRKKNWLACGYHFVIRRDGTIEAGRSVETVGAHAIGWNHNTVAICLVGGRGLSGEDEDNFTASQMSSLNQVCRSLGYPVIGHEALDKKGKTCPVFDWRFWASENGLPIYERT